MTTAPSLIQRLDAQLSEAGRVALDVCVRLCEERGVALYLVGGAVRDLLLGVGHVDLDLTLEVDTAPIARAAAEVVGGRVVTHERFDTATVKGEAFELDLARTRRETYPVPGALPEVEPATLAEDLARRDFTIAAMALQLTRPEGALIDPFGGRRDLENRLIRVLHERSFKDDATRILRAVRYAARLRFQIEASTLAWLRRDLHYLHRISGPRVRRELTLMFEEERGVEGVLAACDLGIIEAVHPDLSLDDGVATRWRDALNAPHQVPRDELGLCLLISTADEPTVDALSIRLHLTARQRSALLDLTRLESLSSNLTAASGDPAAVVSVLDGRALSAVRALGVRHGGVIAQACEAYIDHWRHVRPHLRGHELQELGVRVGPAVGETLDRLRAARLQGLVESREDEIELVKRALVESGG